ncbi:MAG: hypothetical protein QOH34_2416, partial [Mycobacterium sp.]|nr:hypothetical protein [Mycobacterium sp.]
MAALSGMARARFSDLRHVEDAT